MMIIPTIYGSILRSDNNINERLFQYHFFIYICILFCLFDQKTRSAIERNMNALTGQTSNTANTPIVKQNEMNTGVRIVFFMQSILLFEARIFAEYAYSFALFFIQSKKASKQFIRCVICHLNQTFFVLIVEQALIEHKFEIESGNTIHFARSFSVKKH